MPDDPPSSNRPWIQASRNGQGSGEPTNLARIYSTHAARVSGWARRILDSPDDADDVVQDVFVVAQKRIHEFRGDAQITTWLYAITMRTARNYRRKHGGRALGGWLGARALARLPSPIRDAFEQLRSRTEVGLVRRTLDDLPERDRTVLVLFEMEGLSGEQIAGKLGVSPSSVWVRLHRARARFLEKVLTLQSREGDIGHG